jgi:adenine-specific DNA-methyltransferase
MIEEKSLDVLAAKLAQLRELFPEVLTEGKIDFNRLRDVLGDAVNFNKEHYELSWAGKSEARAQIQKATSATLIPDKSGIDADGCHNIFIEGENLEVLHVLQRSYFGKIKIIYIDPPYNTGNDSFVYPDDYSERQDEYKKRAGITDKDGFLNKADLWKKNSKESGQFHSVWLSMMYPRLYLARNLLREDGVIFISIDDNEQANLKLLCDEIFGAENFVANVVWQKKYAVSNDDPGIAPMHDHVLVYQKSNNFNRNLLPRTEKQLNRYTNVDNDPRGSWASGEYVSSKSKAERPTLWYSIKHPRTGEDVWPDENAVWRYSKEKHQQMVIENRLYWGPNHSYQKPRLKRFLAEIQDGIVPSTWWSFEYAGHNDEAQKETAELLGKKIFSTPKPIRFIKRILEIATSQGSGFSPTEPENVVQDNRAIYQINKDIEYKTKKKYLNRESDIILDFFAGSGATAHAVLDLNEQDGGNRQFICVQLPELLEENSEAYKAGYKTIADICKARITKVIEKIQTERDNNKQTDLIPESPKQLLGFKSFKLAPSNFKQWRGDIDENELLTQLELFKDSEQAYSENHAMLIELLLKAGFTLTANVEINTVAGQELYNVESGKVLFFFDDYNDKVRDFIFNLKPKSVVCLNRVFKNNDTALTNFQLSLKDAGIELQII